MIVKRSETIQFLRRTYTWLLVTLPAPFSFFFFTNEYLILGPPWLITNSDSRVSLFRVFLFFFTRYFVWWPIQPTAYRKQMRNGGIHTESWAKTKPKKFSNASEKQRIASGRFVRFLSTTVIYLGTYCFPRFPTTIKRCVRWFGQRLNWMHSEKKCVLYLEKLQRQSWTTRCVVFALFCWISLALRSHLIKRLNLCKNI